MELVWSFLNTFFLTGLMFWLLSKVLQDDSEVETDVLQEFEDAIVFCKVEQLGDVFYLYNTQDDTFVGQARSIDEFTQLSENLQKHLMIVDGDDEVVDQLKKVTSEISISK